jgi:hypothetical protein
MTIPNAQPHFTASDNAQVGVQSQYAYVDSITLPGDVQLTVEQDAPPKTRYETGVRNLEHGNPGEARRLIWEAMMRNHMSGEVLFYWLVAMLSGRTIRQFSRDEVDQLRHFRLWHAETKDDPWTAGVRLIYQLLDPVLQPPGNKTKPRTDASLLDREFDGLGQKQRDMLRRLDLFLSGPRKDDIWLDELEHARSNQHSEDRLGRAWKFFHPVPARVVIPSPSEHVPAADRRWVKVSTVVFALLTGYVGLELLWQEAIPGLLSYVVALTGGIVAAAGNLESRSWTVLRQTSRGGAHPDVDSAKELTKRIDKLFQSSFDKYEPVEITRRLWQEAAAEVRQLRRDQIIGICLANGFSADQVAWLIRHEVWQLNKHWRDGTLQIPPQQPPLPRRGAVAASRTGLTVMVLGFVLATMVEPGHVLGFAVVLASAAWAWRCWLRVSLAERRHAAEEQERNRRQTSIDDAYRRWSTKLKDRPKDAEMAAWLERDRTLLLGMALDRCHLSRSRVIAHGFLEVPFPGARRSQVEGGLPRYQKYQIQMFLLTEDGFRLVRANLDFLTATLDVRSRTSRSYDSITAVHAEPDRGGGQKFEVRLAHDDPIKVRVRDSGRPTSWDEQDENPQAVAETEEAVDDGMGMDAASVDNTLHIIEGVAADGRKWLQEHAWATAWTAGTASAAGGGIPPPESETRELRHTFTEMGISHGKGKPAS